MDPVQIEARDLPDAWFQTVFKLLDVGKVFKIDQGSYAGHKRLEYDWVTIRVKYPGSKPLLPQIEPHFGIPNPVADDYLDEYLPYLMTGALKPGESYTYGQRLVAYPLPVSFPDPDSRAWLGDKIFNLDINTLIENKIVYFDNGDWFLNQIELLIWTYKNKGFRNNQMVLQIAHPSDMLINDPPCLRHIDTRIQNGKLHFFQYFRSWDLWGGFPANLGGIQLLKEYCAEGIGIEDGEMIATSKGLHLYDYTFDLSKCLRMKDDMELTNG